ncbi:MAG: hypothetical protein COB85_09350 [Bacteroidetes bacterium]|nr:MAG: hypothetical protein COB85_09350 [Bacteroidota bacterium]
MKRIYLSILVICLVTGISFSQTDSDSNQVNEKGLKQGFWVKYYPEGSLLYEGYFIDDRPARLMKRYHKNGAIKSNFIFYDNNKACAAHIFYKDSVLRAQGIYREEKKDSIWVFYNSKGLKVAEENYNMGVKNGLSVSFINGIKPYEKIVWKNGVKNGPWNQFFENGNPRVVGNYVEGKLQGKTTFYNVDGSIGHEGEYRDNIKHGTWVFNKEDGTHKINLIYNMGHVTNQDEYDEYLKKRDEINLKNDR